MDDMGTPGPNHPAHRGLKTPNNVVNLPGRNIGRIRKFKNDLLDAVLGPEKVEYKTGKSTLDEHIDNAIANSGQSEPLNAELGRSTAHFNAGQQEAKIISMGKFKEDKVNRELMDKNNE